MNGVQRIDGTGSNRADRSHDGDGVISCLEVSGNGCLKCVRPHPEVVIDWNQAEISPPNAE